jgi:ATP-binding protein involved in chromosome partitioning
VELHQDIRRGGDQGKPPALAGPDSELAKTFYEVARKLAEMAAKQDTSSGNVIQVT